MSNKPTWENAYVELNKVNKEIVRIFSNEVKEVLKENLDKLWYKGHKNHEYIRTYELLESITTTEVKRNGKYGFICRFS